MTIGVFFSRCNGLISSILDLEELGREFEPDARVRVFDDLYGDPGFENLLQEVEESALDGVILAGVSPVAYQRARNGNYLLRCLAERGVNRNRIEIVNLETFLVLAHEATRSELQKKARLLVEVGMRKVRHSDPIEEVEIAPRKAVAVVGANGSALAASQLLLDAGLKVFLIHEGDVLSLPRDRAEVLRPTLAYVTRHPRFRAYHRSSTTDFSGYAGDYTLEVVADAETVELHVGAVVLSLFDDRKMIKAVRTTFRVDLNEDGSLAALDESAARCQTQERGIFLVNPPPGENGDVSREIIAADATAAMVINLLSASEIRHRVTVSRVDEELCGGCGVCVKTCMFRAVTLTGDPPVSHIDPRRCRGCGNCVTACPAGARDLLACPSAYLFSAIDVLSGFTPEDGRPRVLALICQGCGYPCVDQAVREGHTWPVGVLPLSVTCGGQIDMQMILHAYVRGFDGVALVICSEGCCHNVIGNVDLERRVNLFRAILTHRGIDDRRLRVIATCSRVGKACADALCEFHGHLARSGNGHGAGSDRSAESRGRVS
ncbi:MAG: hydrogenase iron-sulfur subunit [Planctomycetota bacterium]|jgi:heterodisulfide reductase subunit A-like polyferredoxin/coenzyme F420-reducing hydrogenase delta subunit